VSLLSPEIEDRDEVEVATGRSTKRPSTSSSGSQKKIGHELTYLFFFPCSYIKNTIFKFAAFKF
jgi:hypothetical protein